MSAFFRKKVDVPTRGKGFTDVTAAIREVVAASRVKDGLCSIFIAHTSASLVVQENADPSVLRDLERFFDRLAPENARYEHDAEGSDDMPAHIRSALLHTSETIPIEDGRLLLGTWQAVYLFEHRTRAHSRELVVTVIGESL